jgi:hypothetical protein
MAEAQGDTDQTVANVRIDLIDAENFTINFVRNGERSTANCTPADRCRPGG